MQDCVINLERNNSFADANLLSLQPIIMLESFALSIVWVSNYTYFNIGTAGDISFPVIEKVALI